PRPEKRGLEFASPSVRTVGRRPPRRVFQGPATGRCTIPIPISVGRRLETDNKETSLRMRFRTLPCLFLWGALPVFCATDARDAEFAGEDTVQITLDTFLTCKRNDLSSFAANVLGTRSAHVAGGRAGKTEWQGDWQAAAKRRADGWTCEMRIPWAALNYPGGR